MADLNADTADTSAASPLLPREAQSRSGVPLVDFFKNMGQQTQYEKALASYEPVGKAVSESLAAGDFPGAARAAAMWNQTHAQIYGPQIANAVTQPTIQTVMYLSKINALQPGTAGAQQGGAPADYNAALAGAAAFDPSIDAGKLSHILSNTSAATLNQAKTTSEEQLRGPKAQWLTGQTGALPSKTGLEGAQTGLANAQANLANAKAGQTPANPNQAAATKEYDKTFADTQKLLSSAGNIFGPTMGDTQGAQIRSQLQTQIQQLNAKAQAAGAAERWSIFNVGGKAIIGPAEGAGAAGPAAQQAGQVGDQSAETGQSLAPPPGSTGMGIQAPPAPAQAPGQAAAQAVGQSAAQTPAPAPPTPTAQPQAPQQAPTRPGNVMDLSKLIPPALKQRLDAGQRVGATEMTQALQQQGITDPAQIQQYLQLIAAAYPPVQNAPVR